MHEKQRNVPPVRDLGGVLGGGLTSVGRSKPTTTLLRGTVFMASPGYRRWSEHNLGRGKISRPSWIRCVLREAPACSILLVNSLPGPTSPVTSRARRTESPSCCRSPAYPHLDLQFCQLADHRDARTDGSKSGPLTRGEVRRGEESVQAAHLDDEGQQGNHGCGAHESRMVGQGLAAEQTAGVASNFERDAPVEVRELPDTGNNSRADLSGREPCLAAARPQR